jgi:type IV pilus assembly protein PilF
MRLPWTSRANSESEPLQVHQASFRVSGNTAREFRDRRTVVPMTRHAQTWIARLIAAPVFAVWLAACAPLDTKAPTEPELTPAEINVALGLEHWRNHQPQLALDKITEALEQDPLLASAHNVAGLLYERLGEATLAEWHFKRALELDPDDPSARNNYGLFLCNQDRLAQAEKNFLAAADNPNNESPDVAYTNAGICARRIPDLDRAAQYFTAALNANPTMPAALFQIARVSFEKGRYPEAHRELQHYLQVAAHTPETLWLGVQIARALGNREQERRYAQQLQTTFPQSEEAHALFESELRPAYERISPTEPVTVDPGVAAVTTSTDDSFKRGNWVRAQDPQHYTVELFASQNELAMAYFRDQYDLSGELAYFAAQRRNATWYLLVLGSFPDRQQAEKVISRLPEELRNGAARVRRFGDIQQNLRAQNTS